MRTDPLQKPLMKDIEVSNVYQIHIIQTLKFLYKAKNKANLFDEGLKTINHNQPIRFFKTCFKQTKIIAKATSFAISSKMFFVKKTKQD